MKSSKILKTSKAVKFEIKEGKKIVGRAFLYIIQNDLHENPYGLLEDLFVEEEYRSHGLGRQLLLSVVTEAKKRKLYKLIGNSRTFRTQVHHFYEKMGFKKYGFEFRMDF
ncbi:MAG: GNAT family N-acetyltransferase [Candidatus Doudnabacteria bacterium]|jgi:GNAT superfamily N-acetyltransferase